MVTYVLSTMPGAHKLVKNKNKWYLTLIDGILRGFGQIFFMNSSITGLLILIGLLQKSPYLTLTALLGIIVSTLTA